MSFIVRLTDYILDDKRKISSKATIIIASLLIILLVDNILGFSYYYQKEKKIQQIEKLSKVINEQSIDSITRKFIIEQRHEIINRKNIYENIKSIDINHIISEYQLNRYLNEGSKANSIWFNISSGAIWYLLAILIFPAMLFSEKGNSIVMKASLGFICTLIFFGLGILFTYLFSFIPLIYYKTWIWNYILNAILQFTLVALLYYFSIKNNK